MSSRLLMFFMMFFLCSFFSCSGVKKKSEQQDVFPVEKFAILKAKFKGKPVIGSINQAYKDYKLKGDYPWCLRISIALNTDSVDVNGLPSPTTQESAIAYAEEDTLLAAIKTKTTAHYIGHLFNDTFLDVYMYLDDPKIVNAYLQTQVNNPALLRGFGFKINKDPEWDTVVGFMP